MRNPIVAGQFYYADGIELKEQIKSCFLSKFGPGRLPGKGNKRILGIISPHAGYMFSGPCQAFGYKELAESAFPDTYIMLGLSHNGYPTSISKEDFQTPLGVIKNDTELQEELSANIPIIEHAHAYEHSIEVQLPFLQSINPNLKIAPIIASPDVSFKETADNIYKAVKKLKRNISIIASSDFTHYGMNYNYVPFDEGIKENLYKLDKGAIDFILKLKPKEFLKYIERTKATICGKYPIATFLELAKSLGAKKASLLKYYTSGDIVGDYSNSVSYASIKIE